MKITICGSMQFVKQMLDAKNQLAALGHYAFVPDGPAGMTESESLAQKIALDAIKRHYKYIQDSDAALALNYTKKGIPNYIGANTFLELGFAYVLGKKLFVLNPLPDMPYIRDELTAFSPIILNGNLGNIR